MASNDHLTCPQPHPARHCKDAALPKLPIASLDRRIRTCDRTSGVMCSGRILDAQDPSRGVTARTRISSKSRHLSLFPARFSLVPRSFPRACCVSGQGLGRVLARLRSLSNRTSGVEEGMVGPCVIVMAVGPLGGTDRPRRSCYRHFWYFQDTLYLAAPGTHLHLPPAVR